MVDMMTLQGAITSLKTAADIAKGIFDLKSMADVQGKVIELQSTILTAQSSALAAQSEQSVMVQRIRDLEEEIAHIKAWEETKQRYQLISPWKGCHVYALKESSKGPEPPHWICTQCYEDGKKPIFQNAQRYEHRIFRTIKCSRCNLEIDIHGETERRYEPA